MLMGNTEPIASDHAPKAVGPYVHAVRHNDLVYCSGSLPIDATTGDLDQSSLTAETRRCLTNLEAVCRSAGTALEHALRTTIYTTQLDHFTTINEAYAEAFAERVPARTTIGVAALPKGARVEIDAIVAIPMADV